MKKSESLKKLERLTETKVRKLIEVSLLERMWFPKEKEKETFRRQTLQKRKEHIANL